MSGKSNVSPGKKTLRKRGGFSSTGSQEEGKNGLKLLRRIAGTARQQKKNPERQRKRNEEAHKSYFQWAVP